MKIKLPGDIILYKILKVAKRYIFWIVTLSLILLISAYYREAIAQNEIAKFVISRVIPIICFIDYALMIFKMIRGDWIGEIVSVEEKVKPKVIGYSSNNKGKVEYIKSFLITAKKGNGKKAKAKVHNPREELAAGKKMVYIYGAKYAQIIGSKTVRCVICGESNPKESEKCHKCKHSLKITEEL